MTTRIAALRAAELAAAEELLAARAAADQDPEATDPAHVAAERRSSGCWTPAG